MKQVVYVDSVMAFLVREASPQLLHTSTRDSAGF